MHVQSIYVYIYIYIYIYIRRARLRKGERVREKELAAPLLSPPKSLRPSLTWGFAAGSRVSESQRCSAQCGAGHSAATNQRAGSESKTSKQEQQARAAFCFDAFQNLRPSLCFTVSNPL